MYATPLLFKTPFSPPFYTFPLWDLQKPSNTFVLTSLLSSSLVWLHASRHHSPSFLIVLFTDGSSQSYPTSEVWQLSRANLTWTQHSSTGTTTPASRKLINAVLWVDAETACAWVWGGAQLPGQVAGGEMWRLNISDGSWSISGSSGFTAPVYSQGNLADTGRNGEEGRGGEVLINTNRQEHNLYRLHSRLKGVGDGQLA